ncbi:peripheral-type benzodiazepine receptor-associated protein 1-like isoform X1 [Symphalangus syndactylus]|uniref:peripheral-type benzodiazepine receptor-associated protein 1-like isoform X1 n=1 Tax=Symphalangus syndactylus TaxID=9590 RepID=UPI003006933D
MAWDRQGLGLTPLLVPVPVPQPQEGPQWLYVWDFDGLLRESQREVLLLQRQMALRNQRETPPLPPSRPLALLSRPEQGSRLPGPGRGERRRQGQATPQEDADNLPVILGEPEKEQRVQQLESEPSKKRKKCQSLEQEARKKQRRCEELELQLREAQNWWRRSPGSVGEPQRRSRYHFRPGGVGECGAEGPAPGDDTGEGLSPSQEPGPAEQAGEPGGSAEAPSGGGPAAAAAGGGA